MGDYEVIAEDYRNSKLLSFREHIERYTLGQIVGDLHGKRVVDMACGEGYYTRLLRTQGASEVTGVDLSPAMVRLAEEEERREPIGCRYVQADAADYAPAQPVDLVVAAYLLNYARTAEELRGYCEACRRTLRPGGRFVGVNDNVRNPPAAPDAWTQYGLRRECRMPPSEGDVIRYTITNGDGQQFTLDNYYLTPATYEEAFRRTGFGTFRWVDMVLRPSERGDAGFWDEFLTNPPIVGFEAIAD